MAHILDVNRAVFHCCRFADYNQTLPLSQAKIDDLVNFLSQTIIVWLAVVIKLVATCYVGVQMSSLFVLTT